MPRPEERDGEISHRPSRKRLFAQQIDGGTGDQRLRIAIRFRECSAELSEFLRDGILECPLVVAEMPVDLNMDTAVTLMPVTLYYLVLNL